MTVGLFTATQDHLSEFDGTTFTFAVYGPEYVFDPSLETIGDAVADEVDDGDAPGYARQTAEVTWNTELRRLEFDPDDVPTFDLAGATIASLVAYEPSGQPVAWFGFTESAGTDGWRFDAPAIAGFADQSSVLARIAALEAAIDGGSL